MNNIEIERKYLVKDESYKRVAVAVRHLCQGYLSVEKDCTIRVRISDDKAYLTIKSSNKADSIGHFEWEKELEVSDARQLISLCKSGMIEKERYIVPLGELNIEVDVFHGQSEGLVIAEIELPTEDYQLPTLPDFIGEEVTSDKRYYNAYLSMHPYKDWK